MRLAFASLAVLTLAAAPPPPAAAPVRSPGDAVKAAPATDWIEIPAADLLVMDLAGGKHVVIQLAAQFAPVHVANIRTMARTGYWAKATIYRVVDNWVTQWGLGDGPFPTPPSVVARPPEEYQRGPAGLALSRWARPTPIRQWVPMPTAGRSRSRPEVPKPDLLLWRGRCRARRGSRYRQQQRAVRSDWRHGAPARS